MQEIFNLDELEAFLEECGDKIVVIDFWAGWCGPCKLIGPVFERLAKDQSVSDKLVFVKVDVDEATDIAQWIGIECMPMFVFYQNGEKIDEFAGANGQLLEKKIREYAQMS
ncbi:thioredoxin-like [Ruditapes philippinarum]|uniref:thioredoxin-like n=1 Tax=Ruditapes philippinarum TaxID=129788 RepID=UPI00295AE27A|nr:thioredoxin-like [Ruditapes philippinarum]